MVVYVVTEDGCKTGYGSSMYLKGVFTDKGKAAKAMFTGGKITPVELDEYYSLTKDEEGNFENEYYLGGYTE